jgi:hypothetical protein
MGGPKPCKAKLRAIAKANPRISLDTYKVRAAKLMYRVEARTAKRHSAKGFRPALRGAWGWRVAKEGTGTCETLHLEVVPRTSSGNP